MDEEIRQHFDLMLNVIYEVMSSEKYAKNVAKASRNIVNALKAEGFADSEALQILCSLNGQGNRK